MRNLLMLSVAFPPDNTPAAVRPSQLFDYLPEFGYRPFVVASSTDGSTEETDFVSRVPNGREGAGPQFASAMAGYLMRLIGPYNDRWSWVPIAASAGARIVRSKSIAAVYSTSPSLASQLAALWLK